ncbi:MAG: MBL fold metallo-hydrolase [Candidatus Hydrogenedentota bacterium]
MKLRFLGTRGYIEARNRRHYRHSALLVSYRRRRVMIDCGEDWLGHIPKPRPHAIVLTHAHPDHAFGLQDGAPCPVYATAEAWESLEGYPIPSQQRNILAPGKTRAIEGIAFIPYTVEHSTRCPAVGLRITAGRKGIFYVPDVVYLHERDKALAGVTLYIGDGTTLDRSLVRKRGDHLIGHTPVRTQLTWCEKNGIGRAVFTHCGSQIVTGDERRIKAQLREWGRERGVDAQIAHDGMEMVLR